MFCSRRVTYFHVLKFERTKIKVPELFTSCYESVTITKVLCNQSGLCFESTLRVISLSCLEKESNTDDFRTQHLSSKKMVNINTHKEPSVLQFALRKKEKG